MLILAGNTRQGPCAICCLIHMDVSVPTISPHVPTVTTQGFVLWPQAITPDVPAPPTGTEVQGPISAAGSFNSSLNVYLQKPFWWHLLVIKFAFSFWNSTMDRKVSHAEVIHKNMQMIIWFQAG